MSRYIHIGDPVFREAEDQETIRERERKAIEWRAQHRQTTPAALMTPILHDPGVW